MNIFAFSFQLDLGRDWTALSFFVTLLVVLFSVFTVLAGLHSASERLINKIWPATLGVVALIAVVLFSDFRKSGDDAVRLSVETEGLSVESDQGGSQAKVQPEDTFSRTRAYEHEHDGLGRHPHDGVGQHHHD